MPHLKGHSGINWHYEIEGVGEALIFIHGWGVDRRIWRQQSKYFSQYYRVMTIDLPGHGKSSWKNVSLGDMAHDLAKILEHLSFDQITIVGSSLGGLLALKLYGAYPQLFKRLCFVGSMPKFAKTDDFPYGLDVLKMRKLAGQVESDYPTVINIFFRSLFTREERESRRFRWLQKFRQASSENPMQTALGEYLDILEKEDLRTTLSSINIPTQFINGREDAICCAGTVSYMQKVLPRARYDFFEKCGHFPFLSKPHEFNQLLSEFLNETS